MSFSHASSSSRLDAPGGVVPVGVGVGLDVGVAVIVGVVVGVKVGAGAATIPVETSFEGSPIPCLFQPFTR